MRSQRRQNDVFISSRVRQDGEEQEEDKLGGVKGTEECIQREGGIMRKNENG